MPPGTATGSQPRSAAGAVAIGECGLDYHYDHSPRDRQRQAFADQLALAATVARPIIVHTRDAEADTRAMLRDAAHLGVTGVLHCFTGSRELAEAALDAGWYVSFSGIVTFGKWSGDDVVRAIPGNRLLVETDAPYLAPVPHRGHPERTPVRPSHRGPIGHRPRRVARRRSQRDDAERTTALRTGDERVVVGKIRDAPMRAMRATLTRPGSALSGCYQSAGSTLRRSDWPPYRRTFRSLSGPSFARSATWLLSWGSGRTS